MILRDTKTYPNFKNSTDALGRTPIHIAAQHGHADIVAVLLKFNANYNIRDRSGKTPKETAIACNQNEEVIDQFNIEDIFTKQIAPLEVPRKLGS